MSTTSATNRELLAQIRKLALEYVARGETVPSGAKLAKELGNDRDRVQHYLSYLRHRGEIPKVATPKLGSRGLFGAGRNRRDPAPPPTDPVATIRRRIGEITIELGKTETLRAELARLEAALKALEPA